MYDKIELKKPGSIFKFKNEEWIRLGCSHQVLHKPIFIDIHTAKHYHSNQCPTAHIFFQFIAYRKKHVLFYFNDNEQNNLNLILNAIWCDKVWLFLMKKPINIRQEFDENAILLNGVIERNIQESFDTVIIGYIKKIEKKYNIRIPLVINGIIKKHIKIGTAAFYCEGFQQPLFGTTNNEILLKDWLSF